MPRPACCAYDDYFVTPPIFDLIALDRLLDAIDRDRMPPVLVGIMPLRDFDHGEYLQNEVPDTVVPVPIRERLRQAGLHELEIT